MLLFLTKLHPINHHNKIVDIHIEIKEGKLKFPIRLRCENWKNIDRLKESKQLCAEDYQSALEKSEKPSMKVAAGYNERVTW